MKFIYITATGIRHTAFIRYMQNIAPPCLIIREPKVIHNSKKKSKKIIAYNQLLQEYEKLYFDSSEKLYTSNIVSTDPGQVNNEKYIRTIREAQPDIILVFGASLLSRDILQIPKLFSLNIHTGITQLFRGVDSYFWAIHDQKPEGIGATIHIIDNGIDTGNIVLQGRPELSICDDLPDLFFKSVNTGFRLLKESIEKFYSNRMKSYQLTKRGKLYQMKDFNESTFQIAQKSLKSVLREFLKENSSHSWTT